MCNNCIHKAVCSIYTATGGVKKCEHFKEERKGEWIDKMVRDWHCSECGKKVPRQVHFDGYCYNDKLNYCPNCGADMRN